VTKYAPTLDKRFGHQMSQILQRVGKLESRTASIDSGMPLALLPAVIDSGYTGSGNPKAYINGSAALTGPYQVLGSYQPMAGDTVLVAPTPLTAPSVTSYVVLGLLSTPQWTDLSLLESGWSGTLRVQWLEQGIVLVNAAITIAEGATVSDGTTIANLPGAAWYPASFQSINATASNTDEGTGAAIQLPHLVVETSGAIECYGLSSTSAANHVGVNSFYPLT
jgi:hypothetical protein